MIILFIHITHAHTHVCICYVLTFETALLKWAVTNLSGSLNIVKHAISVVLFPSSSMCSFSFFRPFSLSFATTRALSFCSALEMSSS